MTQFTAPTGTPALPGLAFQTNTSSGLYLHSPGLISISASGVEKFDVSTAKITTRENIVYDDQQFLVNGTAAIPSMAFTSDTSSGIYLSALHTVSISANGASVLDVSATNINFNIKTTITGDNRSNVVSPSGNTNAVFNTSGILRSGIEQDVFIGVGAGDSMLTNVVQNDVFIGFNAGHLHTANGAAVIIGSQARENTSGGGGNSVHIGAQCGQNSTGNTQTFVGFAAGTNVKGNVCTIIGTSAVPLATNLGNSVAVGANTFPNLLGTTAPSASNNTCVGDSSGGGIVNGASNSFFGFQASATSDVNFGTALGAQAVVRSGNTVQLGRDGSDVVSCGSSVSVHGIQVLDSKGHLSSGSVAPTVTTGTGAGTGAVASVGPQASSDFTGQITITTGTSPQANQIIVNLNFATSYGIAPVMVITPANAATASLTGALVPSVDDNFTTSSRIRSHNALAASTTYSWWYHVMH